MVDFAYVPKQTGDPFMLEAKAFLALARPALSFGAIGLGNLQSILKWVDDQAQAQRPAEVIVVSHAWPHAMSIDLTPDQRGQSSYTRLVDLQPPNAEFKLPARFKQAPAAGQPRTKLVIKGCQVGRSESYMRLLKTLLGGEIEVSAPQYYEHFISIDKIQLDFLTYGFEIRRRTPIQSHQGLVKEFNDIKFFRYDGSQMPPAEIEALLDQLLGPAQGGFKKLDLKDYLPNESSPPNGELKVVILADLKFPAQSDLKFDKLLGPKRIHKHKFRFVAERVEYVQETVTGTSTMPSDAEIKTRVENLKKNWEDRYGKVNVTGGRTVTKSYGEYLGLDPSEDLFTRIKWEARSTTDGFEVVAVYFRYELEMPVTSVDDGMVFFDGRKQTPTGIEYHTTWPIGPHFAALFRTV